MGLFDFLKRDNKTENSTKDNGELNSHIKSMLEACFEYVEFNDKEVDAIYVLCSAETSYYFTFFFSINGNIVKSIK
jgi:hypothetical protein